MHVVINGKEISSTAAKVGIVVSVMLISALVTAAVVFILLPLVGITVTFSLGLAVLFILASLVGILTLVLGSFLFTTLYGLLNSVLRRCARESGRRYVSTANNGLNIDSAPLRGVS